MTKEEKEMNRKDKLIQNLEAQVKCLEEQSALFAKHENAVCHELEEKNEYCTALLARLVRVEKDLTNMSRVVKIIKASVNGVYMEGEDRVVGSVSVMPFVAH